ncbi:MAG: hypothetical protein LC730_06010, partial [Acidobacteria bacterium]|nr:hypothetical protein [Acidobacteriota bacterium]MCA1608995.1 hypothetical protein [Acidobacteriota bacterium]
MILESDASSFAESPTNLAVVHAGDYLNKLSGERIERECRQKLGEGCSELILNFSRTEIVN